MLTPLPGGEGAVAVASGYTATSSKAMERSLQMAARLPRIRHIHIIMGEGARGEELLSTSQRTTLSHTSGEITKIDSDFN